MEQATSYKRSLSGSVGAGIQSVFGSDGRRFFILEHKVQSKYHNLGESQRIIVDECELGRAPECQVRFDESFSTVSRRHAAIVKEGEGWKLINLSATNTTYLNGHPVTKEWFLQNGDEIQLSTNGPKLGFIVPQGKKGLVSSIGLTARMNLFAQQALRPYKTAIASMALVLVIGGGVAGGLIAHQSQQLIKVSGQLREVKSDNAEQSRLIQETKDNAAKEIAEYKKEIQRLSREVNNTIANNGDISTMLSNQKIYQDVYFFYVDELKFVFNSGKVEKLNSGWSGTGFLLSDGRFVTARHCVQGWLYTAPSMEEELGYASILEANGYGHVYATFKAISPTGNKLSFTSDDFIVDKSKDRMISLGTNEDGSSIMWRLVFPAENNSDPKMWSTDWAYSRATNGQRGNLTMDANLSTSLLPMQKLVVLGFPQGLGVKDGDLIVEPIVNELKTSRKGLASNGCIMHTRGTDHGNSGGPIFAIKQGKFVVVGIVSRGEGRTEEYNWAVPIANIK